MDKRLFQALCCCIFIALNYSAETDLKHDDGQSIYDLPGLFSKTARDFQNSMHLKRFKPLDNVPMLGIDEDFKFKPLNSDSGIQLQNMSKCMEDLIYMVQNIRSEWALKMIDSYGKPESGILNGNFRWVGDYNECIGISVSNPNSTIGNFRGKYCSLTWSLESLIPSLNFSFVNGICVPDSCSAAELQQDALQLMQMAGVLPALNGTNFTMNSDALQCKPTERPLNGAAKSVIALLSIFCALTVLGSSITIAKYFKKIVDESRISFYAGETLVNNELNDDKDNKLNAQSAPDDETLIQANVTVTRRGSVLKNLEMFLGCFCVFTNGAKLLNTSSSEGELLCIHGIRFLSMSWVILGHSYIAGYQQMKNILEAIPMMDSFPFQAVIQGVYSVDSFFILSGFLLTFLCMKELSKGTMSWPCFYIHRFIRLTPIYMLLLGFWATVFLYLGSGPYWPDYDTDPGCKKTWWKNLLYINNFDLEHGECMGWSWYLANDMQFFIISPLFLITLWRWPLIGYCLLTCFLVASFLCNFIITYHFDLSNGFITILNSGSQLTTSMQEYVDYSNKIYVKPYTRIGPYLVGMFTGYIFFKRKANNAPKHSLVFLTVGWIIASSVTLATVYGLYHAHPGLIARSFYNALSRNCWAAGLCWVIYVCLMGQGGFINSLLSFKLFIPLSRLTYAAYLTHPMIITGYLESLRSSLDFSHPTMVIQYLSFMLMTYALSLPVSLILESPIVALEKQIRKIFTAQQKPRAVN